MIVLFVGYGPAELTHLKLQIGWHKFPLRGAQYIQPRSPVTVSAEFTEHAGGGFCSAGEEKP
jgi:hypothetical protein